MVNFPGAMRILLVEDEADLGLAIKQVLISERYVVDWVTDGTEAWLFAHRTTNQGDSRGSTP